LKESHQPTELLEGAEKMARGWESKGVAEQIDQGKEAEQRAAERPPDPDRSPEARMRREQLESLKLSRSRTLAQLERATSPAYRQMLESALQSLERQIEEISRPNS